MSQAMKPYRQREQVIRVHAKGKGLLGLGTLGVHPPLAFSLQPSLPQLIEVRTDDHKRCCQVAKSRVLIRFHDD